MKILVLTKRNMLTMFFCTFIGAITCIIAVNSTVTAITASNTERVIPIYSVNRDDKVCSISFDAAWGDEQTNDLLNTLDKYKVKTTFFLVGSWVDNNPDSVKEIAKRGHDVENHSNTHPHMTQLSPDKMLSELNDCNNKIKALTGKTPTLFRPPYGDYNNQVVKAANSINMYCIQWDIDSLDWQNPSPQDMVESITSKLQNGSIILLHNGAKNTPEALPLIIEAIQSKGYKIIPISEILLKGDYTTDHEGKMHSVQNNATQDTANEAS